MSRALVLSAAAWRRAGEGAWTAGAALPAAGRLAVWAEGWAPAPGAALAAGGAPAPFAMLGATAFAVPQGVPGAVLLLRAAAPPPACRVLLPAAAHHSPTLDGVWPRAVARPAAPAAPDLAAARALMAAALAAGDIDGALGQLADMLAAARRAPETLAAAAALLAHLACHPFCRSPRLGALAAALTDD
ncbi:hypothetical protein [Roseomonas sp. HF4]|uniref:hypothetical protein n=1 Tax=Roseomonas sp. HF4 TaxID=2562313 RepID=UPI0010BFA06D|nr:hypothetical protein [Roseomonas sp. HF4]